MVETAAAPMLDSKIDIEAAPRSSTSAIQGESDALPTLSPGANRLQRFANKLDVIAGFESRGIERVPESMRRGEPAVWDYMQMAVIWFSANCTANNMTVGILGPVTFGLGIKDAMM